MTDNMPAWMRHGLARDDLFRAVYGVGPRDDQVGDSLSDAKLFEDARKTIEYLNTKIKELEDGR